MENYQEINTNGVPPQNFMTLSIIATILGCCTCTFFGLSFILGLIAIYFASQVNPRFYSGDIFGAEKNSKYAKILSFIAIGFVVVNLTYTAYVFIAHPDIYTQQVEEVQRILMEKGIDIEQ